MPPRLVSLDVVLSRLGRVQAGLAVELHVLRVRLVVVSGSASCQWLHARRTTARRPRRSKKAAVDYVCLSYLRHRQRRQLRCLSVASLRLKTLRLGDSGGEARR